jgi:MFS family permease
MTRDYRLVNISLLTWGLGEAAFMYFQPLYLEELGASPTLIGTILGGVGLVMTLVHIPAGYLADRIGRRSLMWAAWLTGIITTGIMATARSLFMFSLGMILYSVTLFVIAPLNSYILSARGKLSVEQAMTINTAAFYFGGIAGPILGGLIAAQLGIRSIFIFSFGIFILSGILILFIRYQEPEKETESKIKELVNNKRFYIFLPLLFIVFFSQYLPQPLTPNFLVNYREISLQTIGILGSITSLGIVLLNLLFSVIPPRIGVILGQIFVGLFSLIVWQRTDMPWLVTAYLLLGGFRATRSLLIAQVEKLVTKSNLGLALGISESVAGLSMIAAPLLAGFLYEKNPTLIFSATLLLLAPSILLTSIGRNTPWNN